MSGKRFFEDFTPGQRFESESRTISSQDVELFIEATGDWHPNHTDTEYCDGHPLLAAPCVQGVMLTSISDTLMTNTLLADLGYSVNYGHDKIRYIRPVYPGDAVRCGTTVVSAEPRDADWGILTAKCEMFNQRSELVMYNINRFMIQCTPAGCRTGSHVPNNSSD